MTSIRPAGFRAVLACLAIVGASATPRAATWYVDADATGLADGSSWSDAFPDLQGALDVAVAGDIVRLAQGVYTPAGPGGSRDARFELPQGVTLLGGHAGAGQPFPDVRVPGFFETTLSGDLAGDDASGLFDDNVQHVLRLDTADVTTTRLDGLVIRGGRADGAGSDGAGAALWQTGPGPVELIDCEVRDNLAQSQGVILADAALTLERCRVHHNIGTSVYAGAGSRLSHGHVHDNVVAGNSPTIHLGASAVVEGSRFEDNEAGHGGALHLTANGLPRSVIRECVFRGNLARGIPFPDWPALGGAVHANGDELDIVDSRFVGNRAENLVAAPFSGAGRGGAVSADAIAVTGCTFSGNSAASANGAGHGGALDLLAGARVAQCTLAGNDAAHFAGGIYVRSPGTPNAPKAMVDNTIVWGNTGASTVENSQIRAEVSTHVLVRWSCVEALAALPSTDSVASDPLLVDIDGADDVLGTDDDDLRLGAGSPVIDAGALGVLPFDVADVDGDGDVAEKLPFDVDFRVRQVDDPATPDTGTGNPPVDMGAHEFGAPAFHGQWLDAGGALAGLLGPPTLTGTGELLGGDSFGLTLAAARPFATAYLVVGLIELAAPFKGGTLVPSPQLVLTVPVAADGAIALAAAWPLGLPPASSLWWQWWIVDVAGPVGFSASNAVESRTP